LGRYSPFCSTTRFARSPFVPVLCSLRRLRCSTLRFTRRVATPVTVPFAFAARGITGLRWCYYRFERCGCGCWLTLVVHYYRVVTLFPPILPLLHSVIRLRSVRLPRLRLRCLFYPIPVSRCEHFAHVSFVSFGALLRCSRLRLLFILVMLRLRFALPARLRRCVCVPIMIVRLPSTFDRVYGCCILRTLVRVAGTFRFAPVLRTVCGFQFWLPLLVAFVLGYVCFAFALFTTTVTLHLVITVTVTAVLPVDCSLQLLIVERYLPYPVATVAFTFPFSTRYR